MASDTLQLSRQVASLASTIEGSKGIDLVLTITDACDALLKQAAAQTTHLEVYGHNELLDMLAGYEGVAKQVDDFGDRVRECLPKQEAEQLKGDIEQHLADQSRSTIEMRGQIDKLRADLASAQQNNDALEADVSQLSGSLGDEAARAAALQQKHDETSALLAKATAAASATQVRLTSVESALASAQAELTGLQEEYERRRAKLAETQSLIDALPPRNAELLEQFRALSARLTDLREAEANCSEERQQELKSQIRELQPRVNELEGDLRALQSRLKELETTRTSFDEQKETLSTDVLETIERSIEQLAPVLEGHRDRLLGTKRTADALSASLAECLKMRADYADWFESTRSPLEAMQEVIARGSPEDAANLANTLNASAIGRVQELSWQASEAIEKLDRLLAACVRAAQLDQEALLRKVR